MKTSHLFFLGLTLIAISSAVAPASADPEDPAWIQRCVADNKDEGQTPATVSTYCTCMVDKMPSSATVTVSVWEKSHAAEQEACSKQAHWQSK